MYVVAFYFIFSFFILSWKKDETEIKSEEKIVKNDDYIPEKFER